MQKEHTPKEDLQRTIGEALDHLAGLAEQDREEWTRLIYFIYLLLVHRRTPTEGQAIGTRITERIAREGYQEAANMARTWAEVMLERGRKEGHVEAAQSIVLGLLTEKFGALPEETEGKVRSLHDRAALDRLSRQVIHAATLNDLYL